MPDDRPRRFRQMFPNVLRPRASSLVVEWPLMAFTTADDTPSCHRRQVETQQLVVVLGDFLRDFPVSEFLGQTFDLVVEDIREALEEEERQQVVLELRCVLLAADGAGSVPQHLLHGLGRRNGRAAVAARPTPGHTLGGFGLAGRGPRRRRLPPRRQAPRIAVRAAFCGLFAPPSQRLTLAKETPSRSASCSCVRSRLARMARRIDAMG